jgi:uncharacterized surface protein with fasciclin (FAS1) repeats
MPAAALYIYRDRNTKAGNNEIMKKENVYQIIKEDERFSVLHKILDRTGIGPAMAKEQKPFTFFAPTDDALSRLPKAALRLLTSSEGRDFAIALLAEHLIPDTYLYADDLRKTRSLKTLHGHKLHITNAKNVLSVGKAHVLTPGRAANNGVVFPVDRLLRTRRKRRVATV